MVQHLLYARLGVSRKIQSEEETNRNTFPGSCGTLAEKQTFSVIIKFRKWRGRGGREGGGEREIITQGKKN